VVMQTEQLAESLEAFSKAQLIEMVLHQAAHITELQQQLQALQSKIEELERSQHRQAAPFRIAEHKRSTAPKPSGQPKGHAAHWRTIDESCIEQTITVPLPCCPYCHGELTHHKNLEQIIEELPPIQPKVYRLITQSGWCEHCHQQLSSTHSLQTSYATGAARVQLGPNAKALVLSLQYEYGMTKRKVCRLLHGVFGLRLSAGALVHITHHSAARLQPRYESLCTQLQHSAVIHSDETSWYVGSPHAWLWVFTNSSATVYKVDNSRSRQVITRMIGDHYTGTLVSDCLAVYDNVNEVQQKCYAHHFRAIRQALTASGNNGEATQLQQGYLHQLEVLLHTALALKAVKVDKPLDVYLSMCQALERQADLLVLPTRNNEVEEKVANRLRKQRDHLFTFLYREEVEATNNRAERQLRPAVISRKLSCGNKTSKGAHSWEVLMSIAATAQQQQQSFRQLVADAIQFSVPSS
jgi:transposase